jgi:putative oxidoreductase
MVLSFAGSAMSRLFSEFPYVSLAKALLILRVSLAIFFMAHAIVRIVHGTIPGFAEFLAVRGWPMALTIVWLITVLEISAGIAMIAGRFVRLAASGLLFVATMGIVIIHAQLGWFVGEHGTGGVEYSLALIVGLIAVAAADRETQHRTDR